MHLGNARTALLAWLDVRARGGRMVLRIEDLDRDRCRPEFADGVRRDLEWLGLDWDVETPPQSTRDGAYEAALEQLTVRGLTYPCFCTRRELTVASAPHGPDGERRYPGTCRPLTAGERMQAAVDGRRYAVRVVMPSEPVSFHDRMAGMITQSVAEVAGDVAVRRSDGLFGYQLAVVVDDAADGVTSVVRGDDLLWSTPRQLVLQRMLELPEPEYAHVPLVLGGDGARLAKRHGAPSLADLRDSGADPEAVVGQLAASAGLVASGEYVLPAELTGSFRLERIGRGTARLGEGGTLKPMLNLPGGAE
jgi:glutamyl-tRNA synthetase